jgi:hypothetical protein
LFNAVEVVPDSGLDLLLDLLFLHELVEEGNLSSINEGSKCGCVLVFLFAAVEVVEHDADAIEGEGEDTASDEHGDDGAYQFQIGVGNDI